ncbi:putative Zn-dependent protease with MMP-like domain [Nocardioides cavernae]|nr:metallopeptidase family protein [Nocardioides cavernae]MBM7514384.1 putative Zn-dependent protease with MMP-like domain [Nocardioides cavernae]
MDIGVGSDTGSERAGEARPRTRDRRGRGMRGPGVVPARPGTTALRTARQRFDQLVLDVVTPLDERWHRHLGLVEYAVEDAPMLPDDWGDETVPLSSLVRGKGQEPTRLVIFRRPIEHRSTSRDELEALVHTIVVEQLAELLNLTPGQVDERYAD